MNIRQENGKDHAQVFELIRRAFEQEVHSDHSEHYLVERLRKSDAFVPELSLVAEIGDRIVGYILLTKIRIINGPSELISLALAPVAVHPDYQGTGIGSGLIRYAHAQARAMGFGSIVLLGHERYYPRFGYEIAKKYGIVLPFDVPDENCMVIELTENALKDHSGLVVYPKEFTE